VDPSLTREHIVCTLWKIAAAREESLHAVLGSLDNARLSLTSNMQTQAEIEYELSVRSMTVFDNHGFEDLVKRSHVLSSKLSAMNIKIEYLRDNIDLFVHACIFPVRVLASPVEGNGLYEFLVMFLESDWTHTVFFDLAQIHLSGLNFEDARNMMVSTINRVNVEYILPKSVKLRELVMQQAFAFPEPQGSP